MWHVGNEYGQLSHGEHAARAFRDWLRRRYGDIDALNRAWGTEVWSLGLRDFEDVIPPRDTPYIVNPTLELDFARFVSDELLDCYLDLARIIREKNPHALVTTNFRSEEHTSELQSRGHLVCRLLLEKKKKL